MRTLDKIRKQGIKILNDAEATKILYDIIVSRLKRIETIEQLRYSSWRIIGRVKNCDTYECVGLAILNKKVMGIYKISLRFDVESLCRDLSREHMDLKSALLRAYRPMANEELKNVPWEFRGLPVYEVKI